MKPTVESLRKQLPRREHRMAEGGAELRAAADGGPRIAMHIPYDRRSETLFGFTEIIKPSAFTKTLQERGADVMAFWNHNTDLPLGRQSNRTLEIRNTDAGLEGVVTLDPKIQWHDSASRSVDRGDVKGSSFGFETIRDNWITEENGDILRELVEVRLFELSPVAFPAYPDSAAEARGGAAAIFDVASVRAGGDLAALAAAIVRMEQGHFATADVAEVRTWVERLQAGLPAVLPTGPFPDTLRRKLDLRARGLGLAA